MSSLEDHSTSPDVAVRIAFDGAPYAGKTTALRALSASLGEDAISKEESEDGRTLWFDWMVHVGGRHEGKPVRAELVTVPGQTDLLDRRRHLIEWSDVIVFLVDSRPDSFAESAAKFAALRRDLEEFGDRPIVVLANKRDVPGAIGADQLSLELGLRPEEPLIETVATTGGGIRQAFVFAVRAAIRRNPVPAPFTDPDELRAAMPTETSTEVKTSTSTDTKAVPNDVPAPTPAPISAEPATPPSIEPRTETGREPSAGRPAVAADPAPRKLRLERQPKTFSEPFLLNAADWRFVVSVANGEVTMPLDPSSPNAEIADRLLRLGLVAEVESQSVVASSDLTPEPVAPQLPAPQPPVPGAPEEFFANRRLSQRLRAQEAATARLGVPGDTLQEIPERPRRGLSENDVERHRALRALRRSIRGY